HGAAATARLRRALTVTGPVPPMTGAVLAGTVPGPSTAVAAARPRWPPHADAVERRGDLGDLRIWGLTRGGHACHSTCTCFLTWICRVTWIRRPPAERPAALPLPHRRKDHRHAIPEPLPQAHRPRR